MTMLVQMMMLVMVMLRRLLLMLRGMGQHAGDELEEDAHEDNE